jgi:hypothetical protein
MHRRVSFGLALPIKKKIIRRVSFGLALPKKKENRKQKKNSKASCGLAHPG